MEFCNSASKGGATLDGKLPQGRTRRSTARKRGGGCVSTHGPAAHIQRLL